ncbi:ABC transporter substrate-binding protein [Metabacillus halosaccharovorans]|uniref:ABC transporter substrate-binding protein n=1 Tax=Metabacillus halosaccharovorans TaxID=930124 RepID=UPI001C1F33EC|nr:extracellular solute-binding protein [Metabacillus halosaccharovorans]MBU7591280.1 extracellular solute-binding protein [Metabacillus halosaccharovorans]
MKRKMFTILLVLMLGIVSACSNSSETQGTSEGSGEKVKLTTAVFGADAEAAQGWMTEIAEKVGVEIDIQVLPDGDQNEQLYKTKAATKSLPDITLYHPGTKFRSDLVPEENLLDLSDQPWVEQISDTSPYSVNEKVYGAPMGGGMGVGVFYNKELFEELGLEIPTTLDDMVEVAKKIKADSDVIPFYVSAENPIGLQTLGLASFATDQANNEKIIEEINENKASFTDAKYFIQAHQMLKDFTNQELINSDYLSASLEHSISALVEGKTAMFLSADFITNILSASYTDEDLNKLGFFPFPSEGKNVYSYKPGYAISVSKTSGNQEKAIDFINYFMTKEGQEIFLKHNKGFKTPALADLGLDASYSNELFNGMATVYAENTPIEMFDGTLIVSPGMWGPVVQEMLMGDKMPEEVAETIQSTIENNGKAEGIPGFTN